MPLNMRARIVILAVVFVVLAAAAYFGSPYWAIQQMRSVAQSGQGDKLVGYVDFPAVRESLKTQFTLMMSNKSVADDRTQRLRTIHLQHLIECSPPR